jgi:hypothetical protein
MLFCFFVLNFYAQNEHVSIHQEQSEYYESLGLSDEDFETYYEPAEMTS